MHDIVIRNGLVVDGTGAPARVQDLAIDGDTLVQVGGDVGRGYEEINAEGHTVTPGFVDLHTHLDAQIGWDPSLTPVSWHGVTSALLGNCGVTFAPCKPEDREYLAAMMETVEDIPKDAILEGLPWTWEGYGGYLDALESLEPAINVGGLVGHCAVRFYVMGERSVEEQATPEELERLTSVAARAVREGALGFSTSRFLGHFLPDGRHVPGTHADPQELVEIARSVGQAGGLMQGVMDFSEGAGPAMELIGDQARAGARVLFSVSAGASPRFGNELDAAVSEMRRDGLDVNAVSIPRGGGFVSGLHSGFLVRSKRWKAFFKQPFEKRLSDLDDPAVVSGLIEDAKSEDYSRVFGSMFFMGEDAPDYTEAQPSLQVMADRAGIHPAQMWLDKMRETRGRGLFTYRVFNRSLDSLQSLITTDWCLPGLGDAGAHVGQIMDCGWATFTLSHWHRDAAVYSLEECVQRLTSTPARILGLADRGTLKEGRKADLNVIDLDRLGEEMPEFVYDFPGGAGRFVQRARGYRATFCNGRSIVRDDELTGERGGRVLRR